jgi:hypothetical protein
MAHPINEYQILRTLRAAFTALKQTGSAFDQTFKYLFDILDLSAEERSAFKDIIINDKIQYMTTYSNLSTDLPTIVVVMDQETQIESQKPIGDVLGSATITDGEVTYDSEEYGVVMQGVYSINVLAKQILLVRLLGTFVRFILESYSATHDDMPDLDINTDRFSPDAEYFPSDVFHVHLIVRYRYVESWNEIYGPISDIFLNSCGGDFWQNIDGSGAEPV